MWDIRDHPSAAAEYAVLDASEQVAVDNAIAKLRAIGPALGFPHSSAVKGTYRLRELRPRGGRSITQALYRQFGDRFVIGAYGPEEAGEPAAFTRACELAEARLESLT